MDKTLLRAALDSIPGLVGMPFTIDEDGGVSINGRVSQRGLTVEVNRAYSKQVVMSQAKRFGWKINEQPDGKLVVQKATF